MTPREARLAALVAALEPRGAAALLARAALPLAAPEAERLSALPRRARLEALAAALSPALESRPPGGPCPSGRMDEPPWLAEALARGSGAPGGARHPGVPGDRLLRRVARQLSLPAASAEQTRVRAADTGPGHDAGRGADVPSARSVNRDHGVLPFELSPVTRGRAEVDASARALGRRACRAAAEAVGAALGMETRLEGRLRPGPSSLGAAALVPIELPALPGAAVLVVECSFAARLAERLAGGPGESWLATALTPAESAVLDLAVLAALQGVCSLAEVEGALSPRLGLHASPPKSPLVVELALAADGIAGRAVLALPPAAVRALRARPRLADGLEGVAVAGSLRSGQVRLDASELGQLGCGDVLLLDEPPGPGPGAVLALAGGARAAGRLSAVGLEVSEVRMVELTETAAEVPLLVEVELARVAVALGDLARLEPGGVLPLPIDRSGRVTLRLGGRELAVGELVDVDGAVGVRVLRLEGSP